MAAVRILFHNGQTVKITQTSTTAPAIKHGKPVGHPLGDSTGPTRK